MSLADIEPVLAALADIYPDIVREENPVFNDPQRIIDALTRGETIYVMGDRMITADHLHEEEWLSQAGFTGAKGLQITENGIRIFNHVRIPPRPDGRRWRYEWEPVQTWDTLLNSTNEQKDTSNEDEKNEEEKGGVNPEDLPINNFSQSDDNKHGETDETEQEENEGKDEEEEEETEDEEEDEEVPVVHDYDRQEMNTEYRPEFTPSNNLSLQLRPEFKKAFKNAGLLQKMLQRTTADKEIAKLAKFTYVPYGDGEQTIGAEMGRNEIVNSNAREKRIRYGRKMFRTATYNEPVGSNLWQRNPTPVHEPHIRKKLKRDTLSTALHPAIQPATESLISVQGHNLITPEADISIPTYVQDRNLIGSFELAAGRPMRK